MQERDHKRIVRTGHIVTYLAITMNAFTQTDHVMTLLRTPLVDHDGCGPCIFICAVEPVSVLAHSAQRLLHQIIDLLIRHPQPVREIAQHPGKVGNVGEHDYNPSMETPSKHIKPPSWPWEP
jgi:hypothetical protein